MPTPKYKLRIKQLQFISAVDRPAQETARARLIKRADDRDDVAASFKVAKVDELLGIVLGWALTSTVPGPDGQPVDYHDLQGDTVSEAELVKVAAEYAMAGGQVDEQHDEVPGAGRAVFLFPLTSEIAKALGIETATTGLLAGIKVAPEVLARFQSGELTGFSIGGIGARESLDSTPTPSASKSAPLSPYEVASKRTIAAVESYAKAHNITSFEQALAEATQLDDATRDAYNSMRSIARGDVATFGTSRPSPQTVDVVKTAQIAFTKAQQSHDEYLAKRARDLGVPRSVAIAQLSATDREYRDRYDALHAAREDMRNAPLVAATKALDDELSRLAKSIDSQKEAFSLAHDKEPHEAHERLLKISPTYRAQFERMHEASHERMMRAEAVRRAQQSP